MSTAKSGTRSLRAWRYDLNDSACFLAASCGATVSALPLCGHAVRSDLPPVAGIRSLEGSGGPGTLTQQSLVQVFRSALGSDPSDWKKGGRLGVSEIESLRLQYLTWAAGSEDLQHPPDQLWPLISHHDDVDSNVVLRNFVATRPPLRDYRLKDPIGELKAHLIACNGVVLADPLRRVFFDIDGHEVLHPSGDDILRVADRVGQLETLLRQDVVRISKVHPNLSSPERQTFIAPFNIGPNMRTLTDLIQEGHWVPSRPRPERNYSHSKSKPCYPPVASGAQISLPEARHWNGL